MRLDQDLLPLQSDHANSGYISMWHISQKLILLTQLLSEMENVDRSQGDAYRVHGSGKLISRVGMFF